MSIEPQQQKPKACSVFATGLALFSMFFGAGNLVFPLLVGRTAGTEAGSALMGLAISAVAFPFLGLVAMMFYGGDLKAFSARLGKWPAFLLMFVLAMSQGPVGAMPRLFTLMHASIKAYLPDFSLPLFSIAIAAFVFWMTIRPHRIVQWLGVILTPLLLLMLGILVAVGLFHAPEPVAVAEGGFHYFKEGLKGGYQTLDLTAALLFASIIMPYLAKGIDPNGSTSKQLIRKRMLGASLIAAGLLMVSYIGLCWIAARYGHGFETAVSDVDLLYVIAVRVLGPYGSMIATGAVFLACLTTAISLAAVFSSYLKKEFFQDKIKGSTSLVITLGATAAMANLGFSGIMKFLVPALEILYPGLIVLCLFNIAHHLYQVKPIRTPVFAALALASFGSVFL